MRKYLLVLAIFSSLNTFAKSEKSTEAKRMPASIEMGGQEAKSLFFSVYAIHASGGKAQIIRDLNNGEMVVSVGDNAKGSVSCKSFPMKSPSKPEDANYTCSVK